jgi:amino acid adenylation domain-containing protein
VSTPSSPMKGAVSSRMLPGSDEGRTCRLSYAQERLWLIDQTKSSAGYNLPLGIRIQGALKEAALEKSLQEVLRRHDALRTRFIVRDGVPFQQIFPRIEFRLNTVDLANVPEAVQQEEIQKNTQSEARQIFHLDQGPLFRAKLLRLGDQDHVLLITMHHIVSDGWSIGVLLEELVALYAAFSQGQPSPLPELPVQYADFAEWQRQWLSGEVLEQQLGYWKKQLGDLPPPLELPADRLEPGSRSFQGNIYRFTIAPEITAALRRLARENRASMFMVLLAAWQVLLHRYSGQPDVLIGTAVANRNRLHLEKLIGFFVNTLVLRADLSGHPSFSEVLRRARETSLGAQEHQDLPFEKLVAELAPQRSPADNPFFRVMFNWLNLPISKMELAGLKWEHLEQAVTVNRFDLMLTVFEGKDELPGFFEYSTDLFDGPAIARFAGHLKVLLANVASNPEQKIDALNYLTPEERKQLETWAGAEAPYPRDSSVSGLFELQVEQTPETIAMVFEGRKISYRELNAKANQVARYLQSIGIRTEDRVAVCLDRSPEMIIALLGILKCGGVYVALDPAFPAERLAFILQATRSQVIITQESLQNNLPDHPAIRTLCIGRNWPAVEQMDSSDLKLQLSAGNLAYIAYTSGSTGVPKGVAVSHRAIIRLVRGNNYARFGPQETFLQFAPVAFDASTFEIWGCLLNGGKLVIASAGIAGMENLGALLRGEKVTTAWLTAGLFHWMVENQLDGLCAVPQVLAGGDVLSKSHVMKFLAAAPAGATLINGYGPTENTTFTCCHSIGKGSHFSASVPVGRPIANTQVYVLDAQMQLLPSGAPGELFIGGDGLARGYWEQADLTAEKFIPNPFSRKPGERLYRSGDRMRWLADGTLEFLGRMDTQVKIRGYRVELGEIESSLNLHPKIRESAVLAMTQSSGEKTLVAYFSCRAPNEIAAEELRDYLRARLPDYMVPSAFVLAKEFTLTANGKIDRKALASIPIGKAERTLPVPPRTSMEKVIAQIWSEVLARPDVGIEDDFFQLGGHSLQATQIMLRVRDVFQVDDFPLRRLFESPSIAGLARSLKDQYDPETLEMIAQTVLEAQDLPPEQIEKLLS